MTPARSCPTCHSIGPRRIVGPAPAPGGALDPSEFRLCPDTWHARSVAQLVSTGHLPQSGLPEPSAATATPVEAERDRLKAERDMLRAELRTVNGLLTEARAEIERGRENLRQEELRHQLAEREAAILRAEVRHLAADVDRLRGLRREQSEWVSCTLRMTPDGATLDRSGIKDCGTCLPCRIRAEATR